MQAWNEASRSSEQTCGCFSEFKQIFTLAPFLTSPFFDQPYGLRELIQLCNGIEMSSK
jgi:hypothetical protein